MMNEKLKQNSGYEKRDVNIKSMIVIGLSIVTFIVLSLIFINEIFLMEKEKIIYETVLQPESVTLQDLKEKEDIVLDNYKLLNDTTGVYQIPIVRAMEIMAEEATQSE
jgi:hypothetical protein